MDLQQVKNFKQLIDYVDKNNLLKINTQWENICSKFNIDTSISLPKDHNGIVIAGDLKKYQISAKIRELIADKPGDLSEVFNLMDMLYYEQVIDDLDNNICISIASRLRDALNNAGNVESYSKIFFNENWQKAIELLFIIADGKYDYNYISQQKTVQAHSIKYLIKLGFNIDWKERPTTPLLPDTEIVNKIDKLIDKIGRFSVVWYCVNRLNTCYSPQMCRYIIPRNASLLGECVVSFPYVYLLNLALKNICFLQSDLSKEEIEKARRELETLVQNYINCYNLERTYPVVTLGAQDLPFFLMREVLFDTCCIPKQLPSKQVELLVNKLFSWVKNDDADFFRKIRQYVRIFHNLNFRFSQKSFPQPIILKYKDLQIFGLKNIRDLSISSKNINKNFVDPNTFNLNFDNATFANPFIDLGNKQVLALPAPIFNYSFFEKVYTLIRTHMDQINNVGYTSRKIGEQFELFVYERLKNKLPTDFKLLKNKQYNISKMLKKKYSLSRNGGECDLVLETNDDIWLFEMKVKPLTTSAIMGNPNSIILDLSKSLLTSYEQALIVKMLLLNEKKVIFTDGTIIHLNNRRIRTVSLTLYDYGALHTSAFIIQFLGLIFQGMQLNTKSDDPFYLEIVNELNNLYNRVRNVGQGINAYDEHAIRKIIFHQFLNISLLIQILDDFNGDIVSFLDVLKKMQCMSCGMQDSYISYLNIKRLVDSQIK